MVTWLVLALGVNCDLRNVIRISVTWVVTVVLPGVQLGDVRALLEGAMC
jgi:hypothetical protein